MSKISSIEVQLFRLPLAEVLSDAKHGDHTHFELITATVHLADGQQGTGYTYTGGWGGHAIQALIVYDLEPFLVGKDAVDIEALHDGMEWHIHYVGRGGIAAFAMAAIDIALWDIRGKALGLPLSKMAGGAGTRCKAYGGGIDLNFSIEKLLRNVTRYLENGLNGVKIKVGRADLKEDIDRVRQVRQHIGPDISFMVDANYSLDVSTAIEAAKGFESYDLLWFEEPIIPEDLDGYNRIASETTIPLAMGENLHTTFEFEQACRQARLGFLQPDAATCGGITPWLRAAKFAVQNGIQICSHGMQELHVSLLAGQSDPGWLEVHSFPIDQYTTRPLVIEENLAVAPDSSGIGVEFDWGKLAEYRI